MQKPKLDLRRLRDLRLQDIRDRAGRLRQIQVLGSQVGQLRQHPFRAEYLVPVAALLLLVLALIVSYGSAGPIVADRTRTVTPVSGGTPGASATPAAATSVASHTGYPGASPTFAPTTGGPLSTSPVVTGTALVGATGYPGPVGPNGPVPFGTPVAGGVLPGTSTGSAPAGSIPTPAFATPGIPGSSGAFVNPGGQASSGSGYPAPGSGSSSGPNPGAAVGPALIPTPAPFVPPAIVPSQSQPFTAPVRPPAIPGLPLPTPRRPAQSSGGGTVTNPGSSYPAPSQGVVAPPSPALPVPGVATPLQPRTPANPPSNAGSPPTSTSHAPAVRAPSTGATARPPTTSPPAPTAAPPTPTAPPVSLIQGNVRWSTAQSPVVLDRDQVVAKGASLQIDPGVEVRLQPGIDIFVEGKLVAIGTAAEPVRFTGPNGRWNSLAGQAGGVIQLERVELHNAGGGGSAITSSGGSLSLRNVVLTDSAGGIGTNGATVDIRDTQIIGNDLARGPAVLIGVAQDSPVTLRNNIVGGNQVQRGAPQLRLIVGGTGGSALDIQGNGFAGGAGPVLDIQTAAPIGGTIRCNAFRGGTVGLQLSSSTPSARGFSLVVDTNSFEQQTLYGAASTVALGAGNNWWGDPSGPSDAARNPAGRGVRIGVNVSFDPPLTARPVCAPVP